MDSQTPHILATELLNVERNELLNELDKLFNEEDVSRELWAFLWISDIDNLKKIVYEMKTDPRLRGDYELSIERTLVVKNWLQKSCSSSTMSTPTGSQKSSPARLPSRSPGGLKCKLGGELIEARSKSEAENCRKRDNEQCIITKAGAPVEAANIFPFSMRHLKSDDAVGKYYNIWKTLKFFWPEETVNAWFEAVRETTETPRNLLCLSPSAHSYHGKSYFALKPIEMNEDQTELTLQFFWLPRANNPPMMRLSTRPNLPSIGDVRDVGDEGSNKVKLFNVYTDKPIFSGDLILMKTANPEELPLPDVALLEMQWVLNVVAAMSAEAEPTDTDYSDDDDYLDPIMDETMSQISLSPPRCLKSQKLEGEHLYDSTQPSLTTL
ncbi:hypothetical protein A7D00_5864 [Trichophyton violaceum]|uniref:HNH nuclease domain-containing protein n=1 Tax=Trichophyton violaceum TaxID=34388 RepID=A0A178FD43_TRIVO|nr:hypothetical protein A7D00_5864 [Trichophyton violaceum]